MFSCGACTGAYRERWNAMGAALAEHFPEAESVQGMGGSSYRIRLASDTRVDTDVLAKLALDQGILIEPGSVYF